jgi:NADH-quinone oxidoreductase subunit F
VSIIPVLRNLEEFFARESCGWCTPCRDGLPWTVKLLDALERGQGRQGDIEVLKQLTRFLGPRQNVLRACAGSHGAA